MIKITSQRGEVEAYIMEFVTDTRDEVSQLKAKYRTAAAGSVCICLEDSSVWMLGTDWIEI